MTESTVTAPPYGVLVDGAERPAQGGATFDVENPYDRSVICQVADAQPADVDDAVRSAHAAFTDGRS